MKIKVAAFTESEKSINTDRELLLNKSVSVRQSYEDQSLPHCTCDLSSLTSDLQPVNIKYQTTVSANLFLKQFQV